MQEYVETLLAAVSRAAPALAELDAGASAQRPGPGKWSPREIVGHLIDSAAVNHQRFAEAQLTDHLAFSGYQQDEWVKMQRYQDAPWDELVALWAALNRHLARVMRAVPADVRSRPRHRHTLHEIGWRPVPVDQPVALDGLMEDYVGHLLHHLRQILGATWQPVASSGR